MGRQGRAGLDQGEPPVVQLTWHKTPQTSPAGPTRALSATACISTVTASVCWQAATRARPRLTPRHGVRVVWAGQARPASGHPPPLSRGLGLAAYRLPALGEVATDGHGGGVVGAEDAVADGRELAPAGAGQACQPVIGSNSFMDAIPIG
jgi:hypothetical protein